MQHSSMRSSIGSSSAGSAEYCRCCACAALMSVMHWQQSTFLRVAVRQDLSAASAASTAALGALGCWVMPRWLLLWLSFMRVFFAMLPCGGMHVPLYCKQRVSLPAKGTYPFTAGTKSLVGAVLSESTVCITVLEQ